MTVFAASHQHQHASISSFDGHIALDAADATATITVLPECDGSTLQPQTLACPLPEGVVDLSCRTQQRQHDHIHIKIPWQDGTSNASDDTSARSLLPASAYRAAVRLLCRECRQCIVATDGRGVTRVLDMPSAYWREMADLWICHRAEYKIVPEAEALLKARPHHLLASASNLCVHPDQLCRDRVHVNEKARAITVGVTVGIDCMSEVKLDKWTLLVDSDDGGHEHTPPCSFIRYFAIDLVELGRAHAGYRVLIQEQATKQTRVMLWVLNWSTRLLTNTRQPDMHAMDDTPAYWEVIKLLYCRVPADMATADAQTTA
ncbi:HECT-like ubiquitin-conjugating enzyme-binding-domain-containing protein [Syncephalis pseudoplumigaleata]|uniref:HECT-like ubiquitin-conjugating enzyme-binding-domain-containing protein n=1 Tax=Syncephalis pseudoplumigaleata TaxID=1712513 RepID=A0A4P9YTM5_9FUNG|nr:HECT-like ubiquitin-conjugating enzyme-binding-domain-containing protein [Syncephalis pseudoplumigaleata]|eukprot:RKP23277.1 HECT-like ubiquitin-conjugating enzyme-binding-domain-containing protein [Syncephalis pseudoplumigaleata]